MSEDKQDQEPSSVDFERMSKKRYRWVYVAAALVLVVAGVVWFALRSLEREQQKKLAVSWNELGACLLGGPLPQGTTPAARVRNTQLAIMGVPQEKRAKLGDYSWPGSCGKYGHAVSETLRERGKTDGLAESAEKLAKAVKEEKSDLADLSAAIERTWADAASLGLTADEATNVTAPPTALSPLTLETLPVSARLPGKTFPVANVRMQTFLHPVSWFLVDQPDATEGAILCRAGANADPITCAKLPEAAVRLGPGLRLWGTSDDGAQPLLFAGDRGSSGIVRLAGGDKLAETMTYGAWSRADEGATLLVWNDASHEVRFAQYLKGSAPVEKKLLDSKEIGNPYYTTSLLWGWLLYEAYDKDADEIRLYARKLPDAGGEPGALVVAGKVWEAGVVREYQEEPQITGCKTDQGLAVVVAGRTRDSVSFLADNKWTTPVPSEQSGGLLTCRGLEATTTRVSFVQKLERFWPTVTQSRCNVSSCTLGTLRLEDLIPGMVDLAPSETRQVQATEIDGNLALIWHGGDVGGVRMRFAPIERIKDVPDTVIYDDVTEDGKRVISNLLEMRVLTGEGFALLLLSTTKGVHVLRIDAHGGVSPATIKL